MSFPNSRWVTAAGLLLWSLVLSPPASHANGGDAHHWTDQEKGVVRSLWLGSLPKKPENPSNRFADDPKAAALGKAFFFDKRFSGNSKVSCGTCHRPDYDFTDDLPLAHGMGTTARRTMPLAGAAYFDWFFWDGRKDSLWSQALGPIESRVEHGISRTFVLKVILDHYRTEYEGVFGKLPEFTGTRKLAARPAMDDPAAFKAWINIPHGEREKVNMVYANFGKAIEAYVRTIMPAPSRFDDYVEALAGGDGEKLRNTFTDDEAEGLRLFIGRAKCTNCHTGPLFTNSGFHNLRIPESGPPDRGRADGILGVLADEFNCLGAYSDAEAGQCSELRFMDTETEKYVGGFKTPSLRNVSDRPPYMHNGQFATIRDVLRFYRDSKNPELGHPGLTDRELEQLEAFLKTLSGPIESLP